MTRYSIKTKILAFFNKIGIRISAFPKRPVASPRGGLEGAVPSGFGGAVGFVGAFILLSLFSCSSDDDGGGRTSKVERQTVRLYLNIPSSDGTRVSDPGQPTGEGIAWDKLAVMIEYPYGVSENENIPGADRHSVIYVDKTDYDAGIDAQGYYWVPLDLPEGKVRFYGVTYSKGEGAHLETDINAIDTSDDATPSFASLEISNDYATANGTMDVAKFLSVATGYYKNATGNRDFTVEQKAEWEDEDMPRMTLTRLAAKIDIQWDAQDAYVNPDGAYTGVRLTGFTFYNNKDAHDGTENNQGCLFPDLHSVDGADGNKPFYNTTSISQRNGRVYHYVFPNGATPEIRFNISANRNGTPLEQPREYVFTLSDKLQKATWYKINTTIKGLEGKTDITVSPGVPGTTTTN